MLLDDRRGRLDADVRAHGLRASPATASDGLPPELAFLVAQGVAPAILRRAARIAEEAGVTGEAALLGLGFPDERFARLLARHLGAPYVQRPPALAREALDPVAAAAVGWAPLAPNSGNLGHVFAPRGEALRLLLRDHRFADVGTYGFAVTTRRRFEALLRRHDEAGFRDRAAGGLAGWDAALSARGGVPGRQRLLALALAAALGAGFVLAPGITAACASAALFAVFAAAVGQRLLVVAAGGAEGGRLERRLADRDLPVYTLIVPLFREARMLAGLVRAVEALDYPALCRKRNKGHRLWLHQRVISLTPTPPPSSSRSRTPAW